MIELAPGRFSTTIGWPMFCDTLLETSRVTPSAPPPGGKPTTQLIGFDGKGCCACAAPSDSAPAANRNSRLRIVISNRHYRNDRGVIRRALARARAYIDVVRRAAHRRAN